MKKILFPILALILLATLCHSASAQDMSLYVDKSFKPAMKELLPLFKVQTGFEIKLVLRTTPALVKRILESGSADLFFPASEEAMRQVMEKGLVDVALKRNIVLLPSTEPAEEGVAHPPQYIAAAVLLNAPHRLQAMAFLEFLTSEESRNVFSRLGYSLP